MLYTFGCKAMKRTKQRQKNQRKTNIAANPSECKNFCLIKFSSLIVAFNLVCAVLFYRVSFVNSLCFQQARSYLKRALSGSVTEKKTTHTEQNSTFCLSFCFAFKYGCMLCFHHMLSCILHMRSLLLQRCHIHRCTRKKNCVFSMILLVIFTQTTRYIKHSY